MSLASLHYPTQGQAIGAILIAWGLWKVLRKLTRRDPLDNIPGPRPKSKLQGSFPELVDAHGWGFHQEISEKYGGVFKFKGFLGANLLYVSDPKALHHLVVKDQHIYEEADLFIMLNQAVFGKGLFATTGDHHRKQRKMLNPVFSINHMREMIPIFYDVVNKLGEAFQAKVQDGPQTFDVLAWMTRTALELIGQSGLGYSFDPLTENGKQHPYTVSVKTLVVAEERLRLSIFVWLPLLGNIGTPRFRRRVVDALSLVWPNLRKLRDLVDIMDQTAVDILKEKKTALKQGADAIEALAGRGKDIMSILLKANMLASEEDKLPDSELLGQMSSLTFAAMDTTSNALSRILHQLSLHPDVQDRLRQELVEAQEKHGQLEYDELVNLPYLDAVCRETLRLYPPVTMILREAHQDGILPVSKPIIGVNFKEMNEVFVPKGTKIFISILASNRKPELWGPDAYEWKPERWLSPLPEKVVNAKIPGVYSNLMTFLGGGRACIGFKFSQLEMKVVLAVLIPRFKFELGADTKEIKWLMSSVAQPAVEVDGKLETQLPLKVTPLH